MLFMLVVVFLLQGESVLDLFFFFQAEDGIRDADVTGVQTCALPILPKSVVLAPPRCECSAQCRPAKPTITPVLRKASTKSSPSGPKIPSIVSAPTRERREAIARQGRHTTEKNWRAIRGSRLIRRGSRNVTKNSASISKISPTLAMPTRIRIPPACQMAPTYTGLGHGASRSKRPRSPQ